MSIFNFLLDNKDIIFYTVFTGVTSVIGWSCFVKSIKSNGLETVQTFSQGTMTSPITDLTEGPRTFSFSVDQLREIENLAEQAIQIDTKLDGLLIPISNKGIQAVSDVSNIGIQVKPSLRIDTFASEAVSIFRNIDLNNLANAFRSTTSNSIKAVPDVNSPEVKTLIDNLTPVFQGINPDLIVRADLVEFGTSPVPGLAVDVLTAIANYYPIC